MNNMIIPAFVISLCVLCGVYCAGGIEHVPDDVMTIYVQDDLSELAMTRWEIVGVDSDGNKEVFCTGGKSSVAYRVERPVGQ